VRAEVEDRAATSALAEARARSTEEDMPDRRELDELEQKLAETLAARSAAEARADTAAAQRDRFEAELAELGAGRPATEVSPQAPIEVETQVTVLTSERDHAVAEASRLAEARDEAVEQAEAEAAMREELQAQLVQAPATDDPTGRSAARGRKGSAGGSRRGVRSEYVVGWVLLLLALGAAIAMITGVVRIALVP